MRVPRVSERIKEAPAHALRGVFAGIGQLLLVSDKIRHKTPGHDVPAARTPEQWDAAVVGAPQSRASAEPEGTVAGTAVAPADADVKAPDVAGQADVTEPAEEAGGLAAIGLAAPEKAGADAASAPAEAKLAATEKAAPARAKAARTSKPRTAAATPTPAAKAPAKVPGSNADSQQQPSLPMPPAAKDFDRTGNVRVLGNQDSAPAAEASAVAGSPAAAESAAPAAATKRAAAAKPARTATTAPKGATRTAKTSAKATERAAEAATPAAAAAGAGVAAAAGTLPLANYDELSVPSLRARLRNLDINQVRQLAEYERAHAGRADVIASFERRIAKLAAEA